ncbi:hypothetical protein BT96DRAFT_1005134 [Gymnopus androsaceus JB14]|uniref:Uncharacterized protein n=1 Tax=Gymnopus androsaceus JB14 TaxID=1447944 RepID=A0A6A4GP78_9AGAR|nr:hypothetical protein BT96DRAFT_1005134 [Gymnopus androsaceus JB14]
MPNKKLTPEDIECFQRRAPRAGYWLGVLLTHPFIHGPPVSSHQITPQQAPPHNQGPYPPQYLPPPGPPPGYHLQGPPPPPGPPPGYHLQGPLPPPYWALYFQQQPPSHYQTHLTQNVNPLTPQHPDPHSMWLLSKFVSCTNGHLLTCS